VSDKDTTADSRTGRGNKPGDSGNFGWFAKAALRIINEEVGTTAEIASARAIYFTLCQMASDAHSDAFVATIPKIGALAGYCDRTTGERLSALERLGLLRIVRPPIKQGATYTLLRVGHDAQEKSKSSMTIGSNCGSTGIPIGGSKIPVVDKEEKEGTKESKEPVETSAAESIFQAYPRWEAKKRSLMQISKALADVDADVLLAAVRRYKKRVESDGTEMKFIPTAATFFGEERWKQYVTVVRQGVESSGVIPLSQELENFLCTLNHFEGREDPGGADLAIAFYAKLSPQDVDRLTLDQRAQFFKLQRKFEFSGNAMAGELHATG
jgi:hypothetical protein